MNSYLYLLILVIISSGGDCIDLNFNDCGGKEIKAVRSSTCDVDPCLVPIGGDVSVEVDFVPKSNSKKATIGVFASLWGFEMGLDLDDNDACVKGRLPCPIQAGQLTTLKYDFKVKDDYVPVSGDVGFRLTDEDGQVVACATISAELYAKDEHQEL